MTAIVIGLVVAIYILDVMPSYLAVADAPPEPEIEDAEIDDDGPNLADDDVQELAAIGGCMIDGRHDAARIRFENWMDEIEPAWRSLR
jgi:hypothetical protein